MALIKLDSVELKNQASEMTALSSEYEHLFSGVNSILNDVNNNWSPNLANNFSGKIANAQKGFSNVVEMLKFGADAANSSAESFSNIDMEISRLMGGNLHSGSSGTVHGGGGASIPVISRSDIRYMSASKSNIVSGTISGDYGDDVKDTVEDTYHNIIEGDDVADDGYTISTYGTTTGRQEIIGDIYYEKRRGVEEYYADYDKGNNYEAALGKISKTAEEIIIGQGCEEQIHIKINHIDFHGDAKFDPGKGSAYVSAGMEYDVASVGFEIGDSKDGLGAAEANLKIGIGAGVKAGVHNGIVKVDASLAAGVGIDLSFEINYKNWKDAFIDAFSIG